MRCVLKIFGAISSFVLFASLSSGALAESSKFQIEQEVRNDATFFPLVGGGYVFRFDFNFSGQDFAQGGLKKRDPAMSLDLAINSRGQIEEVAISRVNSIAVYSVSQAGGKFSLKLKPGEESLMSGTNGNILSGRTKYTEAKAYLFEHVPGEIASTNQRVFQTLGLEKRLISQRPKEKIQPTEQKIDRKAFLKEIDQDLSATKPREEPQAESPAKAKTQPTADSGRRFQFPKDPFSNMD